MTYYIYKITNLINQKIYIGKTNNPKRRWYHHVRDSKKPSDHPRKFIIHHAISKYGKDNFSFEIIDSDEDEKIIFQKEIDLIKYFKNLGEVLYNVTNGGEGVNGYLPTEETRNKISLANKGKLAGKNNPMFGQGDLVLGDKNPFYGKTHSEESKNKMSKMRLGEGNSRAILNEQAVCEIRLNVNNLTVKELALLYKINIQTIYRIKNRTLWNHLD